MLGYYNKTEAMQDKSKQESVENISHAIALAELLQGSRNRGGRGGGGGGGPLVPPTFVKGGPGPPNIYQELQ